MKVCITLLLAALALTAKASASEFSPEEMRKILLHGPWPPPWRADPSNRVSGQPEAIKLGERLFFEPRLSGTGSVLCATCHVPFRGPSCLSRIADKPVSRRCEATKVAW